MSGWGEGGVRIIWCLRLCEKLGSEGWTGKKAPSHRVSRHQSKWTEFPWGGIKLAREREMFLHFSVITLKKKYGYNITYNTTFTSFFLHQWEDLKLFFIQILFQLSGVNTFQTNQVIPSSGAVVTAVTGVCLPWQPYQQCINKQVRDGGICLWMGAGEDSERPISFWNHWELGSHTGWDVRNYHRNAICVQSQQGHLSCREKKRLNLII